MKLETVINLIKHFPCPSEDTVVRTVNYIRLATAQLPYVLRKLHHILGNCSSFSSQINSVANILLEIPHSETGCLLSFSGYVEVFLVFFITGLCES